MIALILVSLFGCVTERKETTTKGDVEVYVDADVYPIMKIQKDTFESLYKDARVTLIPKSTREVIVQFLNVETTKVAISFRPMNREERAVLERSGLKIDSLKVAMDAVALIIHPTNEVDSLRTTQLDSVFRGTTKTWKELGWKNNSIPIATCIPSQNSGVFENVVLKILHGEKFGPVAQIFNTSDSIIQYVETHQNALGMLSISSLRGKDQNVKILALSDSHAPDSLGIKGLYFTPHQAHMYRGYYPLCSDVYIYYRSDLYSVGTGLVSFIASGQGQKIFLNYGLVPVTQPVRLVELTNREIKP